MYADAFGDAKAFLLSPAVLTPVRIDAWRRELHSIGGAAVAIGATAIGTQVGNLGTLLRERPDDARVASGLRVFLADLEALVAGPRAHLARRALERK